MANANHARTPNTSVHSRFQPMTLAYPGSDREFSALERLYQSEPVCPALVYYSAMQEYLKGTIHNSLSIQVLIQVEHYHCGTKGKNTNVPLNFGIYSLNYSNLLTPLKLTLHISPVELSV